MFQIFCIVVGPTLIVFFTAFEMWMHLFKVLIYFAVAFYLSYFEVVETIKWKWDEEKREKRKAMRNDEADPLHK